MADTLEMIGRYELLSEIGRGGFASVYLARDPLLDGLVAIKVLSDNFVAQADIRQRFISEAKVMRENATHGLVAVHDIGEVENRPFFVMEYCDRGTLQDRLDDLDEPIDIDQARTLAKALSTATKGIHKANIVHRDLKPSNFLIRHTPSKNNPPVPGLLSQREELVLADFGLAKILDTQTSRLTLAGGTPGFGAPEQFRGDPTITVRADVYALAAILVSALSGETPRTVHRPDGQAFSDKAFQATGVLKKGLLRGLEYDPKARQADAVEWLSSLDVGSDHSCTTTKPRLNQGIDKPLFTRRSMLRASGASILTVVTSVALVSSPFRFPGPKIIGPRTGVLGDEAIFTIDGSSRATWTIDNGNKLEGRSIAILPESPGRYRVEAATTLRSSVHLFVVDDPENVLRIVGPGSATIGESTIYEAEGSGDNPSWIIGEKTFTGSTVELTPNSIGTVLVTLSDSGLTTTRSITAIP